ncbi:hypothetical protein QSV37_05180 [Acinetobacter sp. VNK23]|uniref:hypothetical protein n=1 Tax=Acinetobacter thutiue TaxID=2998078 RepID=UPI002578AE2F|nr:hypothetical protein [Acinetobacter thutiue]MDM1019705.1 hypothetical protein [Acinetobacter thutiue]
MSTKVCNSCKKIMRFQDTHCKTCGAEYKKVTPKWIVACAVLAALGFGVVVGMDKNRESDKKTVLQPVETNFSSSNVVIEFNECKGRVKAVQSAVVGTQYKSAVLVDTDIAYMARICTNDGSVLITCSASDRKMVTTKSNDCPL